MSTNFIFSKDLLEYSANHKISLIYASSASVYGEGKAFIEQPKYESYLNHYAESKLMFDNYYRDNKHKIHFAGFLNSCLSPANIQQLKQLIYLDIN